MSSASPFPWDDEDDDQPGVSIRPLSHADLDRILAHLDSDQDLKPTPCPRAKPVRPAARPTAPSTSMGQLGRPGRPGGSAQAEYQHCRTAELATWTRTLPWRIAAALAVGAGIGLLAAQLAPRLAGAGGLLAAAGLGWVLRFRSSSETSAWRRGADGERRTARLLSRLEQRGWVVLHDLAVPGSRANIDHLAIGPGGVVVIDSKQYRGRLQFDPSGLLWHGRHLLTMTLRTARWEADQADEVLGVADVDVDAIVAVHGASVPWGRVVVSGVTVTPADRVPDLLQALPPVLAPERVAWLAGRARLRFRPAA
jgi:hypothetical protein